MSLDIFDLLKELRKRPGLDSVMSKNYIVIVVFAFLAVLNVQAQKQQTLKNPTLLIDLPQNVDTTNLTINYQLTGSFGSYNTFVRTKPDVWGYKIETLYEGKPAEKAKIAVYCPGYEAEVFEFPSLAALPENTQLNLQMKPLGTLKFQGKILLSPDVKLEKHKIQVDYIADWECHFFGLQDCVVPIYNITSVKIERGGKFSIELPDFVKDTVVSSYRNLHSDFRLYIRDEKSGNLLFHLMPQKSKERSQGILLKDKYEEVQVFILKAAN